MTRVVWHGFVTLIDLNLGVGSGGLAAWERRSCLNHCPAGPDDAWDRRIVNIE